ncbi:MAG: hypothetical protein JWL63_2495 [Rhodocyclales bacterium]|nr:hypothetical protein [Rhodocyclales bacterium]
MSELSQEQQEQLNGALSEFVGAFEVVFRYDWEYTTVMIGNEEPNFLEPGVEDESEDWGARGALLEKYRNLVSIMKIRGMSPTFPFPLEHLPGKPTRQW